MKKLAIILLSALAVWAIVNSNLDSPEDWEGFIWPLIALASLLSLVVMFTATVMRTFGNPFRRAEMQYDPQSHLRASDSVGNIGSDGPTT